MPKKKNNTLDLVVEYLAESSRPISDSTKQTYKAIGTSIPFNIQTNSSIYFKMLFADSAK